MRLTHLCQYKDKRKNKEPMTKIRNKLFEIENILEKYGIDDLKVLDKILEIHMFLVNHNYSTMPREDFDAIEKSLKALKIIEDKNVDIEWLKRSEFLRHYNECIGNNHSSLIQQEYDLLKEVML